MDLETIRRIRVLMVGWSCNAVQRFWQKVCNALPRYGSSLGGSLKIRGNLKLRIYKNEHFPLIKKTKKPQWYCSIDTYFNIIYCQIGFGGVFNLS